MKKEAIVLVFLLVLIVLPISYAANIILDPSFEWNNATWTEVQSAGCIANQSSTAQHYSGLASGELNTTGITASSGLASLYQTLNNPITSFNFTDSLSWWALWNANATNGSMDCEVKFTSSGLCSGSLDCNQNDFPKPSCTSCNQCNFTSFTSCGSRYNCDVWDNNQTGCEGATSIGADCTWSAPNCITGDPNNCVDYGWGESDCDYMNVAQCQTLGDCNNTLSGSCGSLPNTTSCSSCGLFSCNWETNNLYYYYDLNNPAPGNSSSDVYLTLTNPTWQKWKQTQRNFWQDWNQTANFSDTQNITQVNLLCEGNSSVAGCSGTLDCTSALSKTICEGCDQCLWGYASCGPLSYSPDCSVWNGNKTGCEAVPTICSWIAGPNLCIAKTSTWCDNISTQSECNNATLGGCAEVGTCANSGSCSAIGSQSMCENFNPGCGGLIGCTTWATETYTFGQDFFWDVFVLNQTEASPEVFVEISLSTNLTAGILFENVDPNTNSNNATGNNVTGDTQYYVTAGAANNVNIDLCIKDDVALTKGGDTIPNTGYKYDFQNAANLPTLPGTAITLSYATIGTYTGITPGSSSYARFWLDVPSAQAAGAYSNTVYIKGIETGASC